MKPKSERQMLNVFLRRQWITECVAEHLINPGLTVKHKQRITISCTNREDKCFELEYLRRVGFSRLGKRWLMWIRGWSVAHLQRAARDQGIEWMSSYAKSVGGDMAQVGIVVDMRDACSLIMALMPNELDRRRDDVYSNDDH